MSNKNETSSGIEMTSFMGFTDELQKIATGVQGFFKSTLSTSASVRKSGLHKAKSSLTTLPNQTSKPSVPTPAQPVDHLGTARTSQPPPVTASE